MSNKSIFVMGDFNTNLPSYESHSETDEFINSMVSHYLIPYILHPTRVTDHSSIVIDNNRSLVYFEFNGFSLDSYLYFH